MKSSFLFLFVMAFLGLTACDSGGGSDNGKFLVVSSTQPANNASAVDARTREIRISFSADIDPSSLGNLQTAIGNLLESQGLRVARASSGEEVSADGLSLQDLVSGEYSILATGPGGADVLVLAANYEFIPEGRGFALRIDLQGLGQSYLFSPQEVADSGIINNDIVIVRAGSRVENVQGVIGVNGSTLIFRSLRFLDWSTEYNVTVDLNIKDREGRSLRNDYIFSFNTIDIPDPVIEDVNPLGIGANPLRNVVARPNFVANPASLQGGNVILQRMDRVSGQAEPNLVNVASAVTYDEVSGNIVIEPNQDLYYLQEYQVTIFGDPEGITGTLGNVEVGLLRDFVWSFTTAAPALTSYLPVVADSEDPVVERDQTIQLNFNFRPRPSQVNSAIRIQAQSGANVPYTYEISGEFQDTVTLTPSELFDYGTRYTVQVDSELSDRNRSDVVLGGDRSFSFTTVRRKVISRVPVPGTSSASRTADVVVSFNFDVADGAFDTNQHFTVERRIDFEPWEPVPGNSTYANRRWTYVPTEEFLYNEQVRVTLYDTLPSADGANLFRTTEWTFTTLNSNLTIASSTPSDGDDFVDFDTEIRVRLNSDIDRSTLPSFDALQVRDCDYRNMIGTVTVDRDTLYFLPGEDFKSFCRYTVTVNRDIRGTENQQQEFTNDISFTTDGLRILGVDVTFAYGDFVDVDTDIEIEFNVPVDFVFSSDIYLEDEFGRRVSGSIFRSGRVVRFNPFYDLDYGVEYELVVTRDVEGDLGEELAAEYSAFFVTENLPVNVVDYGPVGFIFVDDEFWVEVDEDIDEPGFPDYDGDLSPYESFSMSDNGFDEIYLTPTFDLEYDTDYFVTFEFDFFYDFVDDFDFEWSVTTELDPFVDEFDVAAVQAVRASAMTLGETSTRTEAVNPRGCRANMSCRGSLQTDNLADYKLRLAAKRRGSLSDIQSKVRSMMARRNIQRIEEAQRRIEEAASSSF